MQSEPMEMKHLLPLYLTGNLTEEEQRAVERACGGSPELAQELRELQEIKASYRVLEQELPPCAPDLFARVQGAIAAPGRDTAASPAAPTMGFRLAGWMQRVLGSPGLAWGAAAVQFAVILWLVAVPHQDARYQTLSAPAATPGQGAKINVVFQAETTEGQLRALLAEVGGEIVAGPTAKGLYVVQLGAGTPAGEGVDRLRASGLTRFVAEAY